MSWIAIGTTAVSIGGSMYSANQAKKNKGKSGVGPAQVVTSPQYSFTEPRLQQTSDFISSNIQRMSEGKLPSYLDKAMPSMRQTMSTQNKNTYFGSPGQQGPGILDSVKSAGAATGIGPKATMMQTNKALYDYGEKETEIDRYLTKLGVDVMQEDAYRFPSMSNQMPQGPQATVIPGSSYNVPQSPDYMGTAMQGIAGALPYMFDGATTTTGTQGMVGYDDRSSMYQTGMETPEQYSANNYTNNNYSDVRPAAAQNSNVANNIMNSLQAGGSSSVNTPLSSDIVSNNGMYGAYNQSQDMTNYRFGDNEMGNFYEFMEQQLRPNWRY